MRRKWNLVFVLAGLLSLTLVPAAVADEGHAHADKKEVSPSHQAKENLHTAGKEGKGHGHMEMKMTSPARGGMGGHRAEAKEEKGPGHMEMKGTAAGHPAKEGHHAEGKEEKEHGHGAAEMMKGLTPLQAKGLRLVSDLHCNACHYISEALEHGEGHGGGHGGVAPTLGFVGDKFRPDWLFDFIQKPHTIRHWLAIRMPQFRLTEEEAVSLVKHLTEDMKNPEPLPELKFAVSPAERGTLLVSGKKLMSEDYFNCWNCHQQGDKKPDGPRENWGPDLEISARRLRPEWLAQWLRDPQKLMPGTKMPTYFEDDESGPDEILGGSEARQIFAMAERIRELARKEEKKGPSAFERAKKRHPAANRALGTQLMSELNCAGCHDVSGTHERIEAAPPLAHEGSRVTKEWLVDFLKKPYRYRPIGYTSAAASRMPDFRLSGDETEAIAAFLMMQTDERTHAHEKPHPDPEAKVRRGERLFAGMYCRACHETGDVPGIKSGVAPRFAGPNLARAGRRLQEDHLKLWLAGEVTHSGSKLEMDAHPMVPRLGLSKKQIGELAAYLVSLE